MGKKCIKIHFKSAAWFNFALKDLRCKTSLSTLLFIFVYNKFIIVIAGFKLVLLRNAFVTKHYVTKFTIE